ncbi:MAG: hypothetical protein QOE83_868 [Actinomycetota bacterium]|jgi:hypothetical protein|nr:hypothetical protein [Actinomycetota bacterium]
MSSYLEKDRVANSSGKGPALRRSRCLAVIVALATFAAVTATAPPGIARQKAAAGNVSVARSKVTLRGTVNIRQLARQASAATRSDAAAPGVQAPRNQQRPLTGGKAAATQGVAVTNATLLQRGGTAQSYDGLDAADGRRADNGNSFTVEPADGAMCQGGGVAVEYVNSVLQFVDGTGTQLTPPISSTSFYGLPNAFDRDHGTYGPYFPGDINCVYDKGTGRFFLMAWATGQDFFTGAFTGRNVNFFAVQATADPLGDYYVYALEASPPGSPGCHSACFADHPFTATDAHVYEINYNEYNIDTGAFNGTRMQVMSKLDLESGTPSPLVNVDPGSLGGGKLYSLRGGNVPNGGHYAFDNGATLYFLSALEYTGAGDTRIGIEALTDTQKIDSHPAQLGFEKAIVYGVDYYVSPPKSPQKPGPTPLGDSVGEPMNKLDAGGDETQPTKYAGGKLWTVIDTKVGSNTHARGGLLYIVVEPAFDSVYGLGGTVSDQGYVAIAGNWLLYGDIGVKGDGTDPVIMSSVAGPDYYPSAAYGWITPSGVSQLYLYGKGTRPQDGFQCYRAFDPSARNRGCRWGDYNEINWGSDGNYYFEANYVTPRFRVPFANWGTAIGILPG